ncbi:hypothetical protein QQS21_001672 [Conoideocrella luteorostrata]|uniref:Peptidase C14 caspase domain-containing protein n=1 Tax=Conoideocrella luteorostrata TaxID=1105319 RepID=A0AAJ0CWF7_9HYPO|nr:hypothetical protein QQS21_001672 [Conoideocrella luteorostrata]
MSDHHHVLAKHYAVLIGISAYPTSPLKSCVQDVQMIEKCLRDGLDSVDIHALTASSSADQTTASLPQNSELWPTCNNVTSTLDMITSKAQPGDFVYIHFSGHGTRLKVLCSNFSQKATGDLALVLLGEDGSTESFLPGPTFAGHIQGMVDKGLVVTIVLDCCFSATVYRNSDSNSSVRYLPHHPGAGAAADRNASMHDNWLLEPGRYTILAACGPNEFAKVASDTSGSGLTYGALSFFLCQVLSSHGVRRRLREIYRHLRADFWQKRMVQHPVLYGNADQGFFGPVDPFRGVRSIYIIESEGGLGLLAGQAHGLRTGDRLIVSHGEERILGQVASAGALTSHLELPDGGGAVETGWFAAPLTCSCLGEFPIQLAANLPQHDQLLEALQQRSLSTDLDNRQVPTLWLGLSHTDEYEILDGEGRKLNNLPTLRRDQTDVSHICDVLEHLVWFNMVKDLHNPTPATTFQSLFSIQVVKDGMAFSPGQHLQVRQNDTVEILIRNNGNLKLYVFMYNLGPCWQVQGILHETYAVIPPQQEPQNGDVGFTGTRSWKTKFMVPPSMMEHGSCEDVIKIFITSQPTCLDLLERPALEKIAETKLRSRSSYSIGGDLEDWVVADFFFRTTL